jgi:hypothetical protein
MNPGLCPMMQVSSSELIMKPFVIPAISLIAGLALGAGGMFIYELQFGRAPQPAPVAPSALPEESTILPAFKVRAPIVTDDGTLATYAVFTVQLAVAKDAAEHAPEQVPMILNEINMRTYQTPLAKGADGRMPSLQHFQDIVSAAAKPILGQSVLAKVMVTDVSVDETGPL